MKTASHSSLSLQTQSFDPFNTGYALNSPYTFKNTN